MENNEIMMQDIEHNVEMFVKENFKDFHFRQYQKEQICKIIDAVVNNKKLTYIIEAPTGSGKSFINIISAAVLAKYYNYKSYILASDLGLWEQYNTFIKKNPQLKMGTLKGMDNYTCALNQQSIYNRECGIMGESMTNMIKFASSQNYDEYPCLKDCKYMHDRLQSARSNVTLMTYAQYFSSVVLREENENNEFDSRDIIFCDECHNIPSILQLNMSVSLSMSDLKICSALYKYLENMQDLFGFISNDTELEKAYDELMNEIPSETILIDKYNKLFQRALEATNSVDLLDVLKEINNFWLLFSPSADLIYKDIKNKIKSKYAMTKNENHILKVLNQYAVNSAVSALHNIIQYANATEAKYVVKNIGEMANEDSTEKIIDIKFAREDIVAVKYILTKTPRQIMVTATAGDEESFKSNIGVNFVDNKFIFERMNSTFDFTKSPIYIIGKTKMTYANKNTALKEISSMTYKLCEKFSQMKGMIQTSSYEITKYIIDNAPLEIRNRLICYNNSKEKAAAIQTHLFSTDSILIGPSINEGIDLPGDECRFIIITKVPFPNLSDNLVKAKIEYFPNWYSVTTSNSIIQGIGRGNRFKDDWCKTYILDACFIDLYKRTINQYPDYLKDRMKIYK